MGRGSKLLLFLAIISSFFILTSQSEAADQDIIINEIGATETSDYEWVEIYNKGADAVDISGWRFWEGGSRHGIAATGTADLVLQPGEYAVVVDDLDKFLSRYPALAGAALDSSWGTLNNDGEEIGLIDAADNYIEKFTYLSASQFSLERKNPALADYTGTNWTEHASGNTAGVVNSNFDNGSGDAGDGVGDGGNDEPTPTVNNPTPATNSGGGAVAETITIKISISGFLSNPVVGNEWVELKNFTGAEVNLDGYLLCDARDTISTCKILSGSIMPIGILRWDLGSRSFLNNSGDKIILKNKDGVVLDSLEYGEDSEIAAPSLGSEANKVDADNWNLPGGDTDNADAGSAINGGTKSANLFWKIIAPTQAAPGEILSFDSAGSADPRGGSVFFGWNFGDGAWIEGSKIQHSYATSGIFIVTLHATSTAGTVGQRIMVVRVAPNLSIPNGPKISEISANPEGDDEGEFIEIKNFSTTTLDLSGWKLSYEDKEYVLPASTTIKGRGWLVFNKMATKFSLNNKQGMVKLLTTADNLADMVRYGEGEPGQSFSLVDGDWYWAEPNPGFDWPYEMFGRITIDNNLAKKTEKKTVAKTGVVKKIWYGEKSVAAIRTLADGALVGAEGVVVAPPGIFGMQIFYIADASGGLQIYQYKKDFPELRVGDKIKVTGEVSVVGNVRRINIKNKESVDVLATEQTVPQINLQVDEANEDLVGAFIRAEGEVTEIKSNFMYLDNGVSEIKVYLKKGAGIDKKLFKEGELVSVAGVLEWNKDTLELWPRGQADIAVTGKSDDLVAKEKLLAGSATLGTKEKYLTATAGGVTTLLLGFLMRARGAIFRAVGGKAISRIAGIFIKRG
ncbi:MAG: lamin tail domain-containing protein [bacterium]|nr:lamin tail domain-containing protein [bacterium]